MKKIKNVEMFKAGFTNDGRVISFERIKQIIANTIKAMMDGFKPKVKVGDTHSTAEQTGIIELIRRSGESLVGDISIAKEVYDKMVNKQIPEDRSVELGRDFVLSTGEKLGEVLIGVVFGVAEPAEHSLGSIFDDLQDVRVESFEQLTIAKNVSAEILQSRISNLEAERETFIREKETVAKEIENLRDKAKETFLMNLVKENFVVPAQQKHVEFLYDSLIEKMTRDEAENKIRETFSIRIDLHTKAKIKMRKTVEVNDEIDPTIHPTT